MDDKVRLVHARERTETEDIECEVDFDAIHVLGNTPNFNSTGVLGEGLKPEGALRQSCERAGGRKRRRTFHTEVGEWRMVTSVFRWHLSWLKSSLVGYRT